VVVTIMAALIIRTTVCFTRISGAVVEARTRRWTLPRPCSAPGALEKAIIAVAIYGSQGNVSVWPEFRVLAQVVGGDGARRRCALRNARQASFSIDAAEPIDV
jgi:hypothetical protein